MFQEFVDADLEVLLQCFLYYPKELLPVGRETSPFYQNYCQHVISSLPSRLSLSPFLSPYTPVIVVNESIVEDTVYLMHPESSEFVSLFHVCFWYQQHAPHHTREVSQVEHIV